MTTAPLSAADKKHLFLIAFSSFFLSAAFIMLWSGLQAFVAIRAGSDSLPAFFILMAIGGIAGAWLILFPWRQWRAVNQGFAVAAAAFPASIGLAIAEHFLTPASSAPALIAFAGGGAIILSGMVTISLDKLRVVLADCFDFQKIASLEPINAATGMAGTVVGGSVVILLNTIDGPGALFWAASAMIGIALPAYTILRRHMMREKAYVAQELSPGTFRLLTKTSEGRGFSSLVVHMATMYGLSMIFARILSYQFVLAAGAQFTKETELSRFIGLYGIVFGILYAVFVLVFQRRIVEKTGLALSQHIPTAVVGAGLLVIAFHPSFATIIPVILVRDVIMSLQQYAFTIMLTIADARQRNLAWSVIDGPVSVLMTLVGSLILYPFAPKYWGGNFEASAAIAWAALLCIIFRYVLTVRLQHAYPRMVEHQLERHTDTKIRLQALHAITKLRFRHEQAPPLVVAIAADAAAPAELRAAARDALHRFEQDDKSHQAL